VRLFDQPVNRDSVIRRLTEALDVEETKFDCEGSSRRLLNSSGELAENVLVEEDAVDVHDSINVLGEVNLHTSDDKSIETTEVCITVANIVMVMDAEVACASGDTSDSGAPQSRVAMLKLPVKQKEKFLEAEQRELASIEKLGVIEGEVPIPIGKSLIGSRFVYSFKDAIAQEGHGAQSGDLPDLEKARLVMKDFKNREDDFRETYAPTERAVTFHILYLLCIFTAFLYTDFVNSLFRLPISGFKARPQYWCNTLKLLVLSAGIKPLVCDSCLFIYMVVKFSMLVYLYATDIDIVTNAGTEYRQPLTSPSLLIVVEERSGLELDFVIVRVECKS